METIHQYLILAIIQGECTLDYRLDINISLTFLFKVEVIVVVRFVFGVKVFFTFTTKFKVYFDSF